MFSLKLVKVTMDLIPILLGSLPLAHNAQHSLVPSRTTGPRCLYIYIYIYIYVFMYLCIYPVSVYRVPDTVNF